MHPKNDAQKMNRITRRKTPHKIVQALTSESIWFAKSRPEIGGEPQSPLMDSLTTPLLRASTQIAYGIEHRFLKFTKLGILVLPRSLYTFP